MCVCVCGYDGGGWTNIDDVDRSLLVFSARFAVPGYVWIALGNEDVVFGHGVGFCACLYIRQYEDVVDSRVWACLFKFAVWKIGGSHLESSPLWFVSVVWILLFSFSLPSPGCCTGCGWARSHFCFSSNVMGCCWTALFAAADTRISRVNNNPNKEGADGKGKEHMQVWLVWPLWLDSQSRPADCQHRNYSFKLQRLHRLA